MNHKKSHKALIFNIFYLIFVVLTIAAGVLLGSESKVMSFLNSTLKLPESYGTVNGWSLLSVVLFVVLLYALLIEQKEKKYMVFGTIFFFALLICASVLALYPVNSSIMNASFIFLGESVLVGFVITIVLYLLFLPFLLIKRTRKDGEAVIKDLNEEEIPLVKENGAIIEESANLSNQVIKPCLLNETRIRPAPPSSFTRKLHKDGIYLRSKNNYFPLTPGGTIDSPGYFYTGFINKGDYFFIKIEKGKEIDLPEESNYRG